MAKPTLSFVSTHPRGERNARAMELVLRVSGSVVGELMAAPNLTDRAQNIGSASVCAEISRAFKHSIQSLFLVTGFGLHTLLQEPTLVTPSPRYQYTYRKQEMSIEVLVDLGFKPTFHTVHQLEVSNIPRMGLPNK